MEKLGDMVKAAVEGSASGFEDAFNAVMTDKMTAAIEDKYSSMFGGPEATEAADEGTGDE